MTLNEYTLKEVVNFKLIRQNVIAEKLGVTEGAITQMVQSNRDIRIVVDETGNWAAYERRPIPAHSNKRNRNEPTEVSGRTGIRT